MKLLSLALMAALTASDGGDNPSLSLADGGSLTWGATLSVWDVGIYTTCPKRSWVEDRGDAGLLLSQQQGKRLNCLLDACQEHRLTLIEQQNVEPPPPSWLYWAIGVTGAVFTGFAVGYGYAELQRVTR